MPGRKEELSLPEAVEGRVWWLGGGAGRIALHRHDEPEANLIVAGRGVYLVKDRRYELTPGTLVWLFPAWDHLLVDASPDFAMWLLVLKPRLLERICQAAENRVLLNSDPGLRVCSQLDADRCDALQALCRQLSQLPAGDTDRLNAGVGFLALEALAAHREAARIDAGSDVHPAVEQAARRPRDETDPLDLEALAERCGLSPGRLSRLFRQQTGVALAEYRNRQRIERFLRLFARGHRHSMTQAALAAGFGSYAQFHRVFKQLMGQSPAAYRRQLHSK